MCACIADALICPFDCDPMFAEAERMCSVGRVIDLFIIVHGSTRFIPRTAQEVDQVIIQKLEAIIENLQLKIQNCNQVAKLDFLLIR